MDRNQLSYHKRKIIDLGNLIDPTTMKPYLLEGLQLYNPLYSRFFNLNDSNYNNFTLNNHYHIKNLNEVYKIVTVNKEHTYVDISKNVYVKFSPLLDTLKYFTGKYDTSDSNLITLPSVSKNNTCHKKLSCLNNASYVDNFFYYLSSMLLNNHNFVHGMDFYGSFLGIQTDFKVNVVDDLDYLTKSDFFINNIGTLFTTDDIELHSREETQNSKKQKPDLDIVMNEIENDVDFSELTSSLPFVPTVPVCFDHLQSGVETLNITFNDTTNQDLIPELIELNELGADDNIEGYVCDHESESDSESDNSNINYSDDETEEGSEDEMTECSEVGTEDETEDTYSEYSEIDDEIFVKIKKFPTQLICLEKCEDTLDNLLKNNENDDDVIAAFLCQIVMTLLTYQKVFNFTHNDLHTNNIMYIHTEHKFLWYKYNNINYKVPSYGKILKLIDFGRSIYNFNGDVFCSDSFFPGGDGDSQYNCEPFFDITKKRLDPNFSFDLCRLGCSLYNFVFRPDTDLNKLTQLQTTVKRWVTDDNNSNILYKKNGDERYNGFKLYKMISRLVTGHTPENQLNFQLFSQFRHNGKKNTKIQMMDIDKIISTYQQSTYQQST